VRLVTLLVDEHPRTGLVVGDEVVDLADPAVGLPESTVDLPALGEDARPAHQTWFAKLSTCVVGPGAAIQVPSASVQFDYEGELGVVIGRRCRHVPVERALEVVAGHTVVNDVSVRDWQRRTPTMLLGKGFDTHGPRGPWLVAADEIPDPQDLSVRTTVNGETRQDGTTADMIFACAQMIAHLSTVATVEPGTVLATGTPAGVGAATDPRRWPTVGDMVTVEVEGVGVLTNPVVAEPVGP